MRKDIVNDDELSSISSISSISSPTSSISSSISTLISSLTSKPPPKIDDSTKQKRKYTRKQIVRENVGEDGSKIIPESKRRGRKRGRKKGTVEFVFKPEEVLDYVQRTYPLLGIDKIHDKIINGLKVMKEFGNIPYLLYKFRYDDIVYYYDEKGSILNTDGKFVGVFVKQTNGHDKMYMFEQKHMDTQSFQKVIDSIEHKK
jgi:hypothetical protein